MLIRGRVKSHPSLQQPLIRQTPRRPRLGPAGLPVLHRLHSRPQNLRDTGLRDTGRLPQPGPLFGRRHLRLPLQQRVNRVEQLILDLDADLAPDLVQRDFTAPAPNRLWVTDLTMAPTTESPL